MQQAVIGDSWDPQYVEIPVCPESRVITALTLDMEDCTGGKTPGQLPIKGTRSEGTASYPSSPMLPPQQGSANDEAHYITTHEIQLCEADQEPDYPPDFGLAPTTWSEPLDSAPCTFLEYASFDSQGGSPTDEDCSYYLSTTSDPNPTDSLGTDSLGSTELVSSYSESDTSPAPRADESKAAGILLSIKTASKAIKEPSNVQQQQNIAPADAKHETDMTYCVSRATDSKSAFKQHHCLPYPALSDAHRLVAIPARLQARSGVHADISSGASSAVSELDDADKEVRNLTSRAFRSLAYPYFEAINFSSSESTTSLSDQNIGINSWSTYLDWKGSSFLSQKAEKTLHQHSSTTSSLKKIGKDASQVFLQSNKSQTKAYELVVSEVAEKRADPSGPSKRIQSGSRVVTLTETLNLVKASKPHELSLSTDGVTQALPREAAAQELTKHTNSAAEAMEGSNKSKYASSLIKNIISKKMQLEQEIKMERGEITDTSQKHALAKEAEGSKEKSLQSCKFSEAEGSKEKSLQRQNSNFSDTEGFNEKSLQRQSSKFSDTEGFNEKSLQRQSSKFSDTEGFNEKSLQRQSSKFSDTEGFNEKSLQRQNSRFSDTEGSKEKSLQRQSSKFSDAEGSKEKSLQRQSSKFSEAEGSKEKFLQRQSSKFSEAEGSKEKSLQRQSSKFSEAEGSKEKSLQRQSSKFSEAEGSKEKFLQRQSSKFSEAGSDFTLVSSEDFSARDFAPADGNVPPEESSKSSVDTMKGMFLRSQNSAFRSWKEKEIEKMEKKIEEKVAKARRIKIPLERDWRAEFGEISTVQSTKMSRLYVPGIQHIPKEKQAEKQATKYAVSTYAHQTCFSRNENEFKSEKLHILEATAASRMTPMITPKPQEIKLNMGLSSENKDNPFNIAKLLTPNLASTLSKAAEDLRSQVPSRAEVLEKMPQFLVRDIRESKPKTQGTIHQVRDVRKLLKNSYSHDNGDNSDRGSVMSDQSTTDQKTKGTPTSKISSSLSPIMITCQAVKNKEEGDNCQPDAEGGLSPAETVLVHRASGRLPVATIAPNKSGPRMPVVKIVSKASKWKQEKKEQQPEVKVPPQSPQSQAALEKLTAAVKTMEQLYVYDRKEWKRKGGPQPLAGSHVLSMIAGEEGSVARKVATFPEYTKAREEPRKVLAPPFSKAPEPLAPRNSHPGLEKSPVKAENKAPPRTFQVSKFGETKKQDQPKKNSGGTGNVNVFKVSAAPVKNKEQNQEAAMNRKNTRPQPPTSLKIPQLALEEPKKVEPSPPQLPSLVRKASADFENYLTIPVKSADGKPSVGTSARDPPSGNSESTFTPGGTKDYNVNSGNTREPSSIIRDAAATVRDSTSLATLPPFSTKTQASSPIKAPVDWRNKAKEGVQPTRAPSAGSEPQTPDSVPPATIYHHPFPPVAMAMPSPQGPIYYSPPLPSATPAEMYPQTQRKMLVDLATGQYYLVDTPVQPVKRRLFDPETGQYVDIPVPPPPVTPMPLHMPQLALSPGAYGPAYMFYPGFMPTPQSTVLPASTMQTPLSNPGSEHPFEMPGVEGSQQGEMGLLETPYYLATGSSSVPTGQTANIRRGSLGCPDGKQVISILSQPGPRIVAPPSFDGTTMRFVVEHR